MSIPAFESHNIEIEKTNRELDKSQLGLSVETHNQMGKRKSTKIRRINCYVVCNSPYRVNKKALIFNLNDKLLRKKKKKNMTCRFLWAGVDSS